MSPDRYRASQGQEAELPSESFKTERVVRRLRAVLQSWATEMTLLAALVPSLPLKVAVGGEPTGLML